MAGPNPSSRGRGNITQEGDIPTVDKRTPTKQKQGECKLRTALASQGWTNERTGMRGPKQHEDERWIDEPTH